jgi:hypothetical protein
VKSWRRFATRVGLAGIPGGGDGRRFPFALIGARASVLATLDQLRAAVIAAPVPTAGEDHPPLLTRPHDWPPGRP